VLAERLAVIRGERGTPHPQTSRSHSARQRKSA